MSTQQKIMLRPHSETVNHCQFWMLPAEGGTFWMGSPDDDADAFGDEKPRHKVTVSDFWLGKYPVTQALWRAVAQAAPEFGLDENPSEFEGDDRPVEQVSWDDITQKFLPALEKITGKKYRLPTEAEWEYAARGGIYSLPTGEGWGGAGYQYAGSDRLKDVGWFNENSGGETKPVGLKQPNPLGLHDMSGNIYEWCEDDWHNSYQNDPPNQGSAWIDSPRGSYRVRRGGGWGRGERICRAAYRGGISPGDRWHDIGFRLALSPQ